VAARRASNGAGSRLGGAATRDKGGALWSSMVAHGMRLESVGQLGEKGNGPGPGRTIPFSIYSKYLKRLELIQSKVVLTEF
jgi:hypothetical protein